MRRLFNTCFLFFFIACGNSVKLKESPIPNQRELAPESVQNLSFEKIYQEILQPNCTGCHSAYNNYEEVFEQQESILNAVLTGRMPKNSAPLDDNLKMILQDWIAAGAPLNGDTPPPSQPSKPESEPEEEVTPSPKPDLVPMPEPEPEKLTAKWESISKEIIFPKCLQCHNPNGMARFIDLSTREKIFEQRQELFNNFDDIENSHFVQAISGPNPAMPPVWSNIEKLTKEEIEIVIKWIKIGLP